MSEQNNTDANELKTGNTAATREALEHIEKLTREFIVGNYYRPDYTQWVLNIVRVALAAPSRNCDRFVDELDAQLAFLNEVWLIDVDRETMLEQDKYENWTNEMRKRYGKWLFATANEDATNE